MLTRLIKKLYHFKSLLLDILDIKRDYNVNKYSIKISYLHKLNYLQEYHPYYDKFLSYIVKYLPVNSVVVDIGAHIGDTLVNMVSGNSKLNYICIEADKKFFLQLEENIKILKKQNSKLRIKAINEYVGLKINNISLVGSNYTKRALPEAGSIKSKSLTKILNELKIESSSLSLIKTDADGFDWDIINSSNVLLGNCPYLYFECYHSDKYQLENYKILFKKLKKMKYNNFLFFDNFGKNICSINNLRNIYELLDYTKLQPNNKSQLAIIYYDILAYSNNNANIVEKIIKEYNKSIN